MPGEKPFCKRITPGFLKKHLEEYKEWIKEPHYICKKCGRVARRSRDLCEPFPLDPAGGEEQQGE